MGVKPSASDSSCVAFGRFGVAARGNENALPVVLPFSLTCVVYICRLHMVEAPDVCEDELVDAAQVAEMLGLRQRNSVSTYLRRYPGFPRPVVDRGPRRARLWRRADIIRWRTGWKGRSRG